jgi:hypothetical protein
MGFLSKLRHVSPQMKPEPFSSLELGLSHAEPYLHLSHEQSRVQDKSRRCQGSIHRRAQASIRSHR